jgi:predicted NAD/FAD-binding protein
VEANMKIAVVGSGISGLLAARLLADEHEVHVFEVFEANEYAGGHTIWKTVQGGACDTSRHSRSPLPTVFG